LIYAKELCYAYCDILCSYFTVLSSTVLVNIYCLLLFADRYDEDLAQSDLLVHDARGKLGLAVAGGPRAIKDGTRKTPATWK